MISSGPAWFVAHGTQGSTQVRVEAAASYYLPAQAKLTTEDVYRLRQRGFSSPAQGRNLHRSLPLENPGHAREAAQTLLAILRDIYKRPANETLEIQEHHGDADPTSNPRLVRAIRELASSRSQQARNRMYSELLSAKLLVPTDASGELLAFGELEGRPVYGCFIDEQALLGWDPRGVAYKGVAGTALFMALTQTRAASMLINPQGRLGGELYRNEIDALADAARERTAR